jgi:triacylglycerol lipase
MTSAHLLDPELAAGLQAFPPFAALTAETLPQMRAMIAELGAAQIAQIPRDGVVYEDRRIPGPKGAPDVRVAIYRPERQSEPLPVCLHMHGGGMVMGSPEIRHASSIAAAASYPCIVVSVDYRLAPEGPFPAAVEDCYAALAWIWAEADALGADRKRIVAIGESAGGGLAASLAILARDRGEYAIAQQVLTYPMLDNRTGRDYAHDHVGEFVWTRDNNAFGWSAYLGGARNLPPHAVPARCENLERLPPAFIATGSLDLFLEEDMDYARRLIRAGVPTELHVYPGAFHAFDLVADAKLSVALRRDIRGALERAFARRQAHHPI